MNKSLLYALFLTILTISSVTCGTNFSLTPLSKLFETSKSLSKKRGSAGNLCCLPRTVSMLGDYIFFTPNSMINSFNGTSSFYADYKLGKIRQEVSKSPTGQPTPHILYTFRIAGSQYVNFEIMNNQCGCVKYQYDFDWFCLPNQGNISKVRVGNLDAKRIVSKSQQQFMETFIFNNNPSQSENCWILNTYSQDSFGSSLENNYNMVESVDPNVFKVPDICPPIDQCKSE